MLRLAAHLLVALLLSAAPGFWLWSRVRFRTRDPFLAPVVVLGGGLSLSMAALWILYAVGLHTRVAQMALLAAFGVLGALGVRRLLPFAGVCPQAEGGRRRSTAIDGHRSSDIFFRTVRLVSDLLALVAILLFSLGLSKCVLGHPFEAWDAVVSWDKWAEDIARRRFLGGYVSGGYPPGLPLLGGVFYALFQPEGVPAMLGDTARILPALYAVFPVLLGLSLLSLCRTFRLPSPLLVLLVFGNGAVLHCMVKHLGYADVPQMAFLAAALAFAATAVTSVSPPLREEKCPGETTPGPPPFWRGNAPEKLPQVLPPSGRGDAPKGQGGVRRASDPPPKPSAAFLVSFSLRFATAFTKGNGFLLLVLAMPVFLLLDRRRIRPLVVPALAAVALTGIFYLHQWIVGVWWPGLAETSPFHQALPVMVSHKDLVTPDRAHFLRQVELWASYYGLFGVRTARILCAIVFGFLLAALGRRSTRASVVVTLIGMAAVFRAGSYDARNSLFLLVPAGLLVVGGCLRALRCIAGGCGRILAAALRRPLPARWRSAAAVLSLVLVVAGESVLLFACLGRTVSEKRFQTMLRAATTAPLVPPGWSKWRVRGPVPRNAAVHDFLERSPMGRRAAHIRIASPEYRWHSRGVYPLQQNRNNEAASGDLAFSAMHGKATLYTPPPGFVPFASVSGRGYGNVLFVLSPTYADIPASGKGDSASVVISADDLPSGCGNGGFFEVTSVDGGPLPGIHPRFEVPGLLPLEGTTADNHPCLRLPFAEASSYALDATAPVRVRVGY